MNLPTLSGLLKLVGGLSGAALIIYFSLMIHYARKRELAVQEVKVQLARIEGLILGRRGK